MLMGPEPCKVTKRKDSIWENYNKIWSGSTRFTCVYAK